MKILAVSDEIVESLYSPAVRQIARGAEVILSSGDLPSAYLEYMESLLDVPLFYVMGNHGAAGGSKEFPEGGVNLDGRVVYNGGILIAGLEGSIRYNNRPRYQYTEGEMWIKVLRMAPQLLWNRLRYGRYLDILVTHAPPYGIHDGRDLPHTGFRSFVWFLDRFHPDYMVHGHIHAFDNRTVRQTLHGRTLVVNTYGYRLLDYPVRPIR